MCNRSTDQLGAARSARRGCGFLSAGIRVTTWLGLLLIVRLAAAATPSSGTLNSSTPTVTWSGSISGVGTGENTCVNSVSCDSFRVELQPGDYTGKQVIIQVTWSIPAYDYDLYVHEGSLSGPVHAATNGGPPTTEEHVLLAVSPGVVTSSIVWWAHVQAASVPAGQTYFGSASLAALPNSPAVTYLAGSLPFSHSMPLFARGTVRDEEPSVRVDTRGNCYVGGIRGVPAGVDLWRFDLNPASPTFDPEMRNATYLGQPDVFQQAGASDSTAGGADGGGDIDIATSFPTLSNLTPVVTIVSLAVANISSASSADEGMTWQRNAAAATIPSDDRQWIEAYGPNTVYLFYRGAVPSATLYVQKSTDHGVTYGPAVPILNPSSPASTTPGYIAVDQHDGTVYVAHHNSSEEYISHSTDGGLTWTTVLVDNRTGHGHLFDPVKVGDDGTVYTVWSNDRHILYSYSSDHGNTWSTPGIVDDPNRSNTNVFPWLAAGSAGRLDVVWLGTKSANNSAAEWEVCFSQSLNANSAAPVFRQQVISDHHIHGSNISEGGLTGAANRNLGDYFQIAYDPQGAAVVGFADDHNDFDGNSYVTRQLAGPGLLASANGNGNVREVRASPLPFPDMAQPEVVDPAHDAATNSQQVNADNPFDILSISYFANQDGPGGPYIGARMKLSGLTTAPPPGTWRIGFTANAPGIRSQFPDGVSDHGDMFYLLAADTSGTPRFSYGVAYRDSSPLVPVVSAAFAMAYLPPAGLADSAAVDTATSTISIKVAVSKLNALLPAGHPPIGQGSWLCGLRGAAGSLGSGPRDNTRGGLFNFLVNYSGPLDVDTPRPPFALSVSAWPNPVRTESAVRYSLPERGVVSLTVYDIQGKLVRTLASGVAQPGNHVAHWDGHWTGGQAAAPGIYFARLRALGHDVDSKLVVVR